MGRCDYEGECVRVNVSELVRERTSAFAQCMCERECGPECVREGVSTRECGCECMKVRVRVCEYEGAIKK